MVKDETVLAMVQRHVEEGAKHIARQRDIVDYMRLNKRSTNMAEKLLWGFEDLQRQHEEHLLRLVAKN